MLSDLQEKTAKAVVNIFETGRALGNYGSVTLMAGDAGHLTYGRSQTTLASGNLSLLIKAYCDATDAQFAAEFEPYLPRLAACDLSLDDDVTLRGLLREAGDDPVMHDVQDQFFDRVYWGPSARDAARLEVETALGTNVVYDSHVHGSWGRMRDRTNDRHGKVSKIGERRWIGAYISERKDWLANHTNPLLRKTVYRMEAFQNLIGGKKWTLPLPLNVRGVVITKELLTGAAPLRVSAHAAEERTLKLESPPMQGDDVKSVQQALVKAGFNVSPDGIFGPITDAAVKLFQKQKRLTTDGVVGPATRSALGV
jgi:chitosanase